MDEDIPVLLIGDTESRIVRTTASRPEDNAMTSRSTVTVQPDGHAVIETAVSVRGNLAQQLRYALPHMDRGETDRFCQSMLITSAETELVEHHQENLRAIDKPLVIRLKARTTRPFHVIDSCRYVSLPLLDGACRRILQDFDTTLPAVDFRFPTRKLDSVTIVVAESPESSLLLPDAIDRTWSFGRVAMAGTVDGGRATMTMERVSFGYRVTQDEFPLLLEFCETVSTLTRSAIVVCRSE